MRQTTKRHSEFIWQMEVVLLFVAVLAALICVLMGMSAIDAILENSISALGKVFGGTKVPSESLLYNFSTLPILAVVVLTVRWYIFLRRFWQKALSKI